MGTIWEEAEAFEPQKQTKNIADLPEVATDFETYNGEGKNKETGEVFKYKYVQVNGDEYRLPWVVIRDLKVIKEHKPDLKKFKVAKTGSGLDTRYTVIPL